MENNNQNNKNDNQMEIDPDGEGKDLSIEYYEEEDNAYIDEDLVEIDADEFIKTGEMNIINENQNEDQDMEVEQEIYKKEFESFKADGEIYSIDINSKGIIVIGDGEENTYLYDVNNKEIIKKEKLNKDSVNFVKYSNDDKYLATASLDGSVNLWNTEDYTIITTVYGSYADINVSYHYLSSG